MSDLFLLGSGGGFSGDWVDASQSVAAHIAAFGRPGAIMFEYLAERTLGLAMAVDADEAVLRDAEKVRRA